MSMSFCSFATSRLACRLPALKIGTEIEGVKLQACEPDLNSPESDELAVPKSPVRLMVGKNAARAAPMLALAASSVASACRTSGRRANRSEGRPAGCR